MSKGLEWRASVNGGMDVLVWVTPAAVTGSPVDHTWVTSYDSNTSVLMDLNAVIANGQFYWFCWGRFYVNGIPRRPLLTATTTSTSNCLVGANSPTERGTIQWYGIHGVCHQVANQVIYPTRQRVSAARGYRASSAIWGSYGISDRAWNERRRQCATGVSSLSPHFMSARILYTRARYYLGAESRIPQELERQRKLLLDDIDDIGFARKGVSERTPDRVKALNLRIATFLGNAISLLDDRNEIFVKLFGVEPDVEINLIDPELFEFPDVDAER